MRKNNIFAAFLLVFLFAGCGGKKSDVVPSATKVNQPNATNSDKGTMPPDLTTTATETNTTGNDADGSGATSEPANQAPSVQSMKNKAQDLQSINSSLNELDENETLSAE